MKPNILAMAISICTLASGARAGLVWSDQVVTLGRGDTTVGNFESFYGGDSLEQNPTPYTTAQARSAILGPPDGLYTSLPGRNDTPLGQGFRYAYATLSFPMDLDPHGLLLIAEHGAYSERAHLWLWFRNGGNIQPQMTRTTSDLLSVDLSLYASIANQYGGYSNRVSIGGLDIGGPSQGFDLDAVGFVTPEPATGAILLIGFFSAIGRRWGRISLGFHPKH